MRSVHLTCPEHPEATLEGYLLDCRITLGQDYARPAVIVCPGGGYVYCSNAEGEPVALAYTAAGFHAFVLRYSTGKNAAGFAPLQELSWAIGLLRENAEQWHIDPAKIVVCGFSAGGHLALSSGLLARNKPNAMILGYPAVSCPNIPGADFMLKFLTGKEVVTAEDAAAFDLPPQVTKEAPPAFIMATAEDYLTGFGALPLAQKYSQLGIPYELHVFNFGRHGLSLANETSANGSTLYLDPSFSQWHGLSVEWIKRTFGKPEFVEKSNSKMAQYLKEQGIDIPGF